MAVTKEVKPEPKPEAKPGPALLKPEPPKPKPKKAKPAVKRMKSGLIIKMVDLELYRCKINLVMRVENEDTKGFTPEDVDVFYDFLGDGSRDAVSLDMTDNAGFQQEFGNRFIIGILVYAARGETFPRVTLSMVAHESDHCATAICKRLGLIVNEHSGDEAHAYITGYLTKHLHRFLIAHNVFIDNAD